MMLNLLYSVLLSVNLLWHPFHVSVTDIQHNAQEKSVQVSQKIFLDDLEVGLKKFYKLEYLDTYKPEDPVALDSLVGKYLKRKVFFTINGKEHSFKYLGSEVEGDARWCFYEITGVEKVDKVDITNVTLMEVFDDQQNIVHFKSKGKLKSYKLDESVKHYLFDFTK